MRNLLTVLRDHLQVIAILINFTNLLEKNILFNQIMPPYFIIRGTALTITAIIK